MKNFSRVSKLEAEMPMDTTKGNSSAAHVFMRISFSFLYGIQADTNAQMSSSLNDLFGVSSTKEYNTAEEQIRFTVN